MPGADKICSPAGCSTSKEFTPLSRRLRSKVSKLLCSESVSSGSAPGFITVLLGIFRPSESVHSLRCLC